MANGYDECYDASWHLFPPDYVEEDYRILESIKMPRTSFHIHDILQLDSKPSQEETEVQGSTTVLPTTTMVPSASSTVFETHDGQLQPAIYANLNRGTLPPRHLVYWDGRLVQRYQPRYLSPWRKLMCLQQPDSTSPTISDLSFPPKQETNHECKEEESADFEDEQQANEAQPHETEPTRNEKDECLFSKAPNVRAREAFSTTEILERAGKRASGLDHSTDAHAGENLVPESQVQDKTSSH